MDKHIGNAAEEMAAAVSTKYDPTDIHKATLVMYCGAAIIEGWSKDQAIAQLSECWDQMVADEIGLH